MGNKNKKNSNYVTEKTIRAKAEKEKAEKRRKEKKIITAIVAGVLSVALFVGAIFTLGKYAFGWWGGEYEPTVTHHANIELEGYGTLHVELYGEEAPDTVANFIKLANEGFYNGLSFSHLMQDNEKQNVLIQAGKDVDGLDPINGEYSANDFDNNVSHTKGVLSAPKPKTGMGTNPSKFFIMASSDYTDTFDGFYAAFGKVTGGLEYLDSVLEDSANNKSSEGDEKNLYEIHPKKQAKIKSITIHAAH